MALIGLAVAAAVATSSAPAVAAQAHAVATRAPAVATQAHAVATRAPAVAAQAPALTAPLPQSLPGRPDRTVSDFSVGSVLGAVSRATNPIGSALSLGAGALEGNPACGTAGVLSAGAASTCAEEATGRTVLGAGQQLLEGNPAGAVGTVAGGVAGAVASSATTSLALSAVGAWVVGSSESVLQDTSSALGSSTSPQLGTTWFSSTYWRMVAIAAMLTLPFLFAAAVQALLRSDLALLARAAFGYLPLAMLVIAIAAPLTTLLLAACDELCSMISSAAGNESAHFLARAGVDAGALSALVVSPFLAFLIGLFIIGAAFALWVELLLREAAVYVIVLMLPLAFAAFVWPARRIWAIRAVELLMALILSKFAIVAVLSLGGAAISSSGDSVTGLMAGAVLIMLASFTPWALVRLIPLAELASGAAGSLRGELRAAGASAQSAAGLAQTADEWVTRITASMTRDGQSRADDIAPPRRANGSSGGDGEPRDSGAAPAGATPNGAAPTASEPDDGPPPRSKAESWQAQPVLEFSVEGVRATPVAPSWDAE